MALVFLIAVAIPPCIQLCCHGQGDLVIRVLSWDFRSWPRLKPCSPIALL